MSLTLWFILTFMQRNPTPIDTLAPPPLQSFTMDFQVDGKQYEMKSNGQSIKIEEIEFPAFHNIEKMTGMDLAGCFGVAAIGLANSFGIVMFLLGFWKVTLICAAFILIIAIFLKRNWK